MEADGVGGVAPGEGAIGEGEFDVLLVEEFLDTAAVFTADGPLLHGFGFDDEANHDGTVGEVVHAADGDGLEDDVAVSGVVEHVVADLLEELADAVGVLLVGDAYLEDDGGPFFGHVGEGVDFAVLEDVDGAGTVAEGDGAEFDFLDEALGAVDDGPVAGAKLVLEEDEESGYEVAHEFLRPEADSESDDSGAGEDGGDVDVEFGEDDEEEDDPEEYAADAVDDAGEGVDAFGGLVGVDVGGFLCLVDGKVFHFTDGETEETEEADEDEGDDEDGGEGDDAPGEDAGEDVVPESGGEEGFDG